MTYNIITIFPEIFESFIKTSLIGKAVENKTISFNIVDLKKFGLGNYHQLDDKPYGGGPGMILRVDVVDSAIKSINNPGKVIVLSPKGKTYNQQKAKEISNEKNITLLCGRYEGFDQRILDMADDIISIGNFVTMGGEIPAQIIVESTARLVEGVIGDIDSTKEESFSSGSRREHPIYTKPENYNGKSVPKVLLSGNHKEIADWKEKHSK